MNNGQALVQAAVSTVANLAGKPNVFGTAPFYLEADRANTRCSQFFRFLVLRHFCSSEQSFFWFSEFFGANRPNAAQIFNAGKPHFVKTIPEVKAGDVLSITYDAPQNGNTGHTAIVAGPPKRDAHGYTVPVVDSCRTSHGQGDTRYSVLKDGTAEHRGGIGAGHMRLLCDGDGKELTGFAWHTGVESKPCYNNHGQHILIWRLPEQWKPFNPKASDNGSISTPSANIDKEKDHG